MAKKPLKPQVRKIIDEKGPDAAIIWGRKQGMIESTIIFYVTEHLKKTGSKAKSKIIDEIEKARAAKRKAQAEKKKQDPKKEVPARKEKAPSTKRVVPTELYELDYRYHSAEDAKRRRDAICKSSGCDPDCFRIMRKGDRWAVGPRHRDPNAVVPTFKKGDAVMGLGWSLLGKIKEPGPEQSIVEWENGVTQSENNHYLIHKPDDEAPPPAKAKAKSKVKAKAKPVKKK